MSSFDLVDKIRRKTELNLPLLDLSISPQLRTILLQETFRFIHISLLNRKQRKQNSGSEELTKKLHQMEERLSETMTKQQAEEILRKLEACNKMMIEKLI